MNVCKSNCIYVKYTMKWKKNVSIKPNIKLESVWSIFKKIICYNVVWTFIVPSYKNVCSRSLVMFNIHQTHFCDWKRSSAYERFVNISQNILHISQCYLQMSTITGKRQHNHELWTFLVTYEYTHVFNHKII